jgi:hypothetical protein
MKVVTDGLLIFTGIVSLNQGVFRNIPLSGERVPMDIF